MAWAVNRYCDFTWGMPWMGGHVMGLLFWVIIIAVIVYVIKSQKGAEKPESALDILKKRYAAGEITKEEYEQMKADIK